MSAISTITSPAANLAQLLSQTESGLTGGTADVTSLMASGLQNIAQGEQQNTTSSDSASADSTGTSPSSDLQNQVQSAITAAIQSAEESGGSDLKGAVYNALVQVLTSNGIDPTTFQPSAAGGSGSSPTVDSTTSSVLSQVLAAVSGASAATDPAAQLDSSTGGSTSSSGSAFAVKRFIERHERRPGTVPRRGQQYSVLRRLVLAVGRPAKRLFGEFACLLPRLTKQQSRPAGIPLRFRAINSPFAENTRNTFHVRYQ